MLAKLLNWFNAKELASVLRAEAASTWGGTRIDPLTFLVHQDAKSRFYWRVVADCDNPSRIGFGGDEQITLRTYRGFSTKEGAVGNISEIAAFIAPRFPKARLVLRALPEDPLWFNMKENQWRTFPERTWKCRDCATIMVWPPFYGVNDSIPLCSHCDGIMREVKLP